MHIHAFLHACRDTRAVRRIQHVRATTSPSARVAQVSDLSVALWRVSPELARCGSSSLPCRYGPRGSGLWCSSSCCLLWWSKSRQANVAADPREPGASHLLVRAWVPAVRRAGGEALPYSGLAILYSSKFPFLSHAALSFLCLHPVPARVLFSTRAVLALPHAILCPNSAGRGSYRVLTKIFSGREHSSTFTVERRTVRWASDEDSYSARVPFRAC